MAIEKGTTLKDIVELALRQTLMQKRNRSEVFRLKWISVKGRLLPGVDIADRDLLYDAQIVALCREHGVRDILSQDRDFTRFDGITLHRLT